MPLPNFLIIGANKAGTTSLYRYLGEHPEVYMSPAKEPGFFAFDVGQQPGEGDHAIGGSLETYLGLFDGVRDETAIGEASTRYLATATAPARIRATVPDMRLIAVLRNPVERAFSAYSTRVFEGTEHATFAEAVADDLDRRARGEGSQRFYVALGFYGAQLARYLEHFDRERLRVYLYEDLVADPASMLSDVYAFLEVDPTFAPDTTARYNRTRHHPRSMALARMSVPRPAMTLARTVVPVRLRAALRRKLSRVPELPDDVRRLLVDVYRDDVLLTQDLIDRDLSRWLVGSPAS